MRVVLLSLWLVLVLAALSSPRVAADAGSGSVSSEASSGKGGDAVYVGDSSNNSKTEVTPKPDAAKYLVSKNLIESLVFVGSAADPRACIALLVALQYVLAPAHCLAQIDPQASVSEWTVSFGFKAVPYNVTSQTQDSSRGDGDDDQQEETPGKLVGRFEAAERIVVAVASVTYQPDFLLNNSSAAVAVHDWAVVKLAHAVPQNLVRLTKLFLEPRKTVFASATSLIGVLRIDRVSLAVTFVNDNFLLENDRCGVAMTKASDEADAEQESEFLCSVPRRPEERVVDSNSKHWSILVFIAYLSTMFPIGFSTSSSHVDTVSSSPYQLFTFTTEVTKHFINSATNSSVIYIPSRIIIGDEETLTPELMFMAGVRSIRRDQNECGASLVSSNFVLTAAHCVEDTTATRWVSIGTAFSDGVDYGEQIKVLRVILHPEYDHSAMKNDLALLELKYPSIQAPVALYDSQQFPVLPRSGQILGFGATLGAKFSDVLLSAQVNVIASNHACMQLTPDIIDDSMFCAIGQKGADACTGDSGGPLIVEETESGGKKKYLLGVVSYGRGCASGAPGVYANVAYGAAFIKSVLSSSKSKIAVVSVPTSASSPSPSASPVSSTSDTNSITSLSSSSSSQQSSTAPAPATDTAAVSYTFQVPVTLSVSVQSALIDFLGASELSNIDSSYVKALLGGKTIVFESSASLEALKAILTKCSDSTLSQRTSRFNTSSNEQNSSC